MPAGVLPSTCHGPKGKAVPRPPKSVGNKRCSGRTAPAGASRQPHGKPDCDTGAVEANDSVEAVLAKMGNSIEQNETLQRTYMPAVREADAARLRRRKPLGEERNKHEKLKTRRRRKLKPAKSRH